MWSYITLALVLIVPRDSSGPLGRDDNRNPILYSFELGDSSSLPQRALSNSEGEWTESVQKVFHVNYGL